MKKIYFKKADEGSIVYLKSGIIKTLFSPCVGDLIEQNCYSQINSSSSLKVAIKFTLHSMQNEYLFKDINISSFFIDVSIFSGEYGGNMVVHHFDLKESWSREVFLFSADFPVMDLVDRINDPSSHFSPFLYITCKCEYTLKDPYGTVPEEGLPLGSPDLFVFNNSIVDVDTIKGSEPIDQDSIVSTLLVNTKNPILTDNEGRVKLSVDGLDDISMVQTTKTAKTFREMLVKLFMRFFNPVIEKDIDSEIKVDK